MLLTREIIFLDTETTGVDACVDRIVSLGISVLHPDGTVRPKGWEIKFNPGIPIPPEATAVHHITDEDVKDCRPFADYAEKLSKSFVGKDLAGYNLRRLDLPILDEELRRCNFKLDLTGVRVIDVQAIYFKKDPRSLADCIRRYCKREHDGAHGAGADADGTLDALLGQLEEHQDLPNNIDALAKYATMGDQEPVDIAGKFYRDADGDLRFSFGKNKDHKVRDEFGYARWMLEKGTFPGSTLDALREELDRG